MPNSSLFNTQDSIMMARAIALAKRGRFTTAPNPNVGCVIIKNDEIVGEGFHFRAGEPHAEVHALRMAGDQAEGGTAYVTLEPCSHYGRTPPCAEGLIKAKVARVVCAMQDPNPQVAGRGIQMLRDAGITVDVGLLESDAKSLNPAFIKRMQTGMPWVQLKMAASLDGQTALANGESQWITGPKARQDVQAFRAQAGAILSTSKTVIDDNASLNVRWSDFPDYVQTEYQKDTLRQPVRVVLDRQNQLSSLLSSYQSSQQLLSQQESLQKVSGLKLFQCEGEIIQVGEHGQLHPQLTQQGNIDLSSTFKILVDEFNINHLWVEAGATLAQALLQAQLVDEIIIYLAPKLIGADSRGLISALGLTAMSEVLELDIQDVRMVGSDIRVTATILKK